MKTCTVLVLLALVPSLAQIDTSAYPCASELDHSEATGSCGYICEKAENPPYPQTLPCLNKLGIVPVPHCHKGSFSVVEVDNFSQPLHHVFPLPSLITVNHFLACSFQSKMSPDGITLCKFTWSHFLPSPSMVEGLRGKGEPLNRKTPPLLIPKNPNCHHNCSAMVNSKSADDRLPYFHSTFCTSSLRNKWSTRIFSFQRQCL